VSRHEQERLRDIQDAIAAIHRHLEQAGKTTAAREDPLLEILERDIPPLERAIDKLLGNS